ncbi:carbonic anhydrase [Pseudoduganella violaceinigra]|uniref:carbonic anhydrase n=1 Tax=Pseudoduganella violaceinigra TaxID=246602 RepID=UPI00048929EF|nr:carbonic anhydrase family protein [Pseudoduganella violaceinigra]
MRNLIALSACCLVIGTVGAADPVVPPVKGVPNIRPNLAAAAAAEKANLEKDGKPAEAKPADKPKYVPPQRKNAAASAAAQREDEARAEAELSDKIAQRLAEMRANQAARLAAAEKNRKQKAAKVVAEEVAAKAPPPRAYGTHWSYEGESGPANWSRINSDWAKCASGTRQSPIDIRDGMKVDLEQIAFDYRPSGFNVTDNGHTVQVMVGPGNYLSVAGRTYELQQFHFHRPAEERVNGKGFEMVVHLVHKDPEGKLAVLALLLERGKPQPTIQTVWNNLPLEKGDTATPTIVLDPNDLLPQRRDYYTFMGSLTTPPCTEGVLWLVMKEPVQASPAQLALFSRLYPFNARPIQASSGRMIKESN